MRPFLLIAAIVAAAIPSLARSQEVVTLEPGDAISLRVGMDGTMSASPREQAQWTEFDLAAARHFAAIPIPDRPVPQGTLVTGGQGVPLPPPIEPNMIRLKFQSIAGRHSLLVIENGYDRAIVYRARMIRAGQTRPTDVCLVTPNQHGFEHWPFPIDRLEISEVRFVEWRQGDPQPCA